MVRSCNGERGKCTRTDRFVFALNKIANKSCLDKVIDWHDRDETAHFPFAVELRLRAATMHGFEENGEFSP
jgi:hypothetical protein